MIKRSLSIIILFIMLLPIISGCLNIAFETNNGTEKNVEIKFETPMNINKTTDVGITAPASPTGTALASLPAAKATTSLPTSTALAITSTPTLGIGSTVTDKDGMTLVYVPAGKFIMGAKVEDAWAQCQKFNLDCSPSWFRPLSSFKDEDPPHEVYLDAFWIDQTEVTNKMYSLCVSANACKSPKETKSLNRSSYYGNLKYDYYPVINVDWNRAKDYCQWAGRELPTEAQWEKAARGTDQRIYPWGNEINTGLANYANFANSFTAYDTTAVGSYEGGKSPYGAYDMAGNVYEWVADWYDPTYYATLGNNSVNPQRLSSSGQYHVLRGGSFGSQGDEIRSAGRLRMEASGWEFVLGFRCAMSASQ